MYLIYQYPYVYDDFRALCEGDDEMLAELEFAIKRLKQEGPNCPYPTSRYLREDLFELRPQTEEDLDAGIEGRKGRLIYYWDEEKTMTGEIKQRAVIVYAFFKSKTTLKTPDSAIETAKRRRQELQKRANEVQL